MRATHLRWIAASAVLLAGVVGCTTADPEPVPPPPATSAAPTPTVEPVQVTIAAAGDILPHNPVNRSAIRYAQGSDASYDYRPMFADIAPVLSAADVAICHLETAISRDNTSLSVPRSLSFNSPRELATALADAGYDGCEFASNHMWDRGLRGLAATIEVAEEAGLTMAGPRADAATSGEPAMHEVGPATVAHLAYTYTILNEWGPSTTVPDDAPWLARSLWPVAGVGGILKDAKAAREDGADFVVVSMHWGTEYVAEPTEDQRRIARELLKSGEVDLILGAHVHVIQPCETINGRHVIYGMGNSLSNQSPQTSSSGSLPPATQEGMIAQVTLRRDAQGVVTSEFTYHPTRVDLQGHVIRLATKESHPQTYARTVATVESLGEGVCDSTPAS